MPTSGESRPVPRVSVVLPVHDGWRYLREAIASCLAQTLGDLELVLVDDGSKDPRTREILDAQSDPRVRLVRLEKNAGLPAALNAGFRAARGALLTWTSDDNLFRPHALETMARAVDASGADFVYAPCTVVDAQGRETGELRPRPPERLILDNAVGACFLYRRRVLEAVGEYDPAMRLAEDYDYWLRVAARFRMHLLDENLYLYRRHDEALTETAGRARLDAAVERARRKHFPRWRLLEADGLRALDRGDRSAARPLLAGALLRRPAAAARLARPLALAWLPGPIVGLGVRIKRVGRS